MIITVHWNSSQATRALLCEHYWNVLISNDLKKTCQSISINDIFYYVLTFYEKQISSPLISLGSQIGKIINMETIRRIGLRINGFMAEKMIIDYSFQIVYQNLALTLT